jgi:Domain of unknown function (DUF1735)/Domain of unknown function (DUF4361)
MKQPRFNISSLLLLAVTLGSCIKETYKINYTDNTTRPVVEFTNAKDGLNSLALDFGTQPVEVDLTEIRIPPRSVITKDVVVKIQLNNTLITEYNTANQTNYQALPPGSFTIASYDITLPAGVKKANVRLRVKPSDLTGGAYAIGLSISSANEGEISGIHKDIVIALQVKNDYEGAYHATGERIAYTGPANTDPIAGIFGIDDDKYLFTVDQTTVETDVADLVGAFFMYLKVNPANNQVTVLPSALNDTFASLANNGSCTYDPATKTFILHYKYTNAAGALREIEEVIAAK